MAITRRTDFGLGITPNSLPVLNNATGSGVVGTGVGMDQLLANIANTPFFNWGLTSNGSTSPTHPDPGDPVSAAAFAQESLLDTNFGIAGWGTGSAIRGLSQLDGGEGFIASDGTIVRSSRSNEAIDSHVNANGAAVDISARIQWDLGARQAQFGTPEWARKELTNFSPTPNLTGALADEFSRIFSTSMLQYNAPDLRQPVAFYSQGGYIARVGDTPNDVYAALGEPTNSTSFSNGRRVTTNYSPVTSFIGHAEIANADGTSSIVERQFDTIAENVSGYGIPSIGKNSRFAPLGSVEARTGTFFGPQTTITGSGIMNPEQQRAAATSFNNDSFDSYIMPSTTYSNLGDNAGGFAKTVWGDRTASDPFIGTTAYVAAGLNSNYSTVNGKVTAASVLGYKIPTMDVPSASNINWNSFNSFANTTSDWNNKARFW